MLHALTITFRETFETLLVLAILVSYLRRADRPSLRHAAWGGVLAGLLLALPFGHWLQQQNQPLWDGALATVTAILLALLDTLMWRRVLPRANGATWVIVFATAFLVVVREAAGIAVTFAQVSHARFRLGMVVAVLLAGLLAFVFAWFLGRLPDAASVTAAAVLVALLSVQILFFGLHELSEAEVLPNSHTIHEVTEPYSADGRYSLWILLAILAISAAAAATSAREPARR